MIFENIDSGLDRTIAGSEAASTGHRFVVAGDALPAELLFFARRKWQGGSDRRSQLGSQRHRRSPSVWVDGVGQQDDVSLRDRIDPQRRPGESSVTERANRQEVAAIGGERRIDVPAKAPQGSCVGWLLGSRHLLDGEWGEHFAAAEQCLGELGQIIRRRKQAGVAGHSAHTTRTRVVDYRAQHHAIVVVLRGRGLGAP